MGGGFLTKERITGDNFGGNSRKHRQQLQCLAAVNILTAVDVFISYCILFVIVVNSLVLFVSTLHGGGGTSKADLESRINNPG